MIIFLLRLFKFTTFNLNFKSYIYLYYKMCKFILYIFLFILIGCSENNNDNNSSIINFGSDETFDLITWNLEFFPKHNETIDYAKDFILDLNLDVIAMQEISNQNAFTSLVNRLGNQWVGYRSDNSNYQELSYIINTDNIDITNTPYTILDEYEYYFAYRAPYVLEINFQGTDYIIINVHFKCCGDGIIQLDYSDEEYRREKASQYLKNYIDTNFSNRNVVILGDFNDDISENNNNIFIDFINDYENYFFTDMYIAEGNSQDWSFPSYPSHLDHILITNELFVDSINTKTIKLDNYMVGGWQKYDNYISDHRPVGISL
jgi:endonuclease/exonuclease/phosphatase family metal-dependent hydrolase